MKPLYEPCKPRTDLPRSSSGLHLSRRSGMLLLACVLAGPGSALAQVSVSTLHSFTGVDGKTTAENGGTEQAGTGGLPMLPVYDSASERLFGATSYSAIVYTLDPTDGAERDFRAINASPSGANASQANASPSLVKVQDNQYYLNIGQNFYRYTWDVSGRTFSRTPVAYDADPRQIAENVPRGIGDGMWTAGAIGGNPLSLYMVRQTVDRGHRTLWRYNPQDGVFTQIRHWADVFVFEPVFFGEYCTSSARLGDSKPRRQYAVQHHEQRAWQHPCGQRDRK